MPTPRRRFRPSLTDALEPRLVLSEASAQVAQAAPVRAKAAPNTLQTRISDAFASFQKDYAANRLDYYADGSAVPVSTFATYTQQRVNLLAEQLTKIMARVAPSAGGHNGGPDTAGYASRNGTFTAFVRQRINGNRPTSLARTLRTTIAPPETLDASVKLLNQSQDDAIAGARTATIRQVTLQKSTQVASKK